MSEYKFPKPYILNNNWYIFPDTTLEDLTVNDCFNSTSGKCEKTDTLSQCIDLCEKDENCISGYFLETPDKENICVPIHNTAQDYESYVKLVHNIRNKNIFPILKNMKSYVFTTTEYKYPPDNINNLLYIDNVSIENVNTKKGIALDPDNNSIVMSDKEVYVRILPWETDKNPLLVRNGDNVIIVIPNTAYVLRKSDDNILKWTTSILSNNTDDTKLKILSSDKNKKVGDFLTYKDTVYFTHNNNPIVYDTATNSLVIQSMSIENTIASNKNIYFKLNPKVVGYYCNKNNTCTPIELDTDRDVSVYRSPECWNMCENTPVEKSSSTGKIIVYIILVILLLIFLKCFIFDKLLFVNRNKLE